MAEKFVDTRHARSENQQQVMQKIVEADHCPFCPEALRLQLYHKQPILRRNEHWLLAPSQWPRPHAKLYLMVIARMHAEKLSDLPPEAGQDLFELLQWAEKEFDIPGGGLIIRFGDTDYSAASVKHLHGHLIIPDRTASDYEPIRMKIGSSNSE